MILRLTAISIAVGVLSLAAEPATDAVGFVVELKGAAFWRAKPGGEAKPLTDSKMKLMPGQQLRCDPGATLKIMLNSGPVKLDPSPKWFTVTWSPNGSQTEAMAHVQRAFKDYTRPGAGERGAEENLVLAPASGSAVIPERFTIRWAPAAGPLAFQLRAEERNLWHANVEDGASGVLESAEARKALAVFSAAEGSHAVTLSVTGASGNAEVLFSVLTPGDMAKLETEMKFWDAQDSAFLRRIGRASVFAERRMFTEAAGEYEAALNDSPDSKDLLLSTIRIEKRAGNTDRVRELEVRASAVKH